MSKVTIAREIISLLLNKGLTFKDVNDIFDIVRVVISEQATFNIPDEIRLRKSCGSYYESESEANS